MTFWERVQLAYKILTRKAISHHPELNDRVHVLSGEAKEAVTTEMQDYVGFARTFAAYVWVSKAVRVYQTAIGSLPVRVVDVNGKEREGHELTGILEHVNPSDSPSEAWESYCTHMLLGGESFMEFVPDSRGRPAEFWMRRPDETTVIPDTTWPDFPLVAGYTYKDDRDIDPQYMVHAKLHNPLSPWRGLPPIAAVRQEIIVDLNSLNWSKKFLKQGARPDYALIAPAGLTPSERAEYLEILLDKHQGPDNWHLPIILEDGITDIKTFSWAPADIQWIEQRRMSREAIGSIFGVPDEIMGWGKDTYENMDQAHRWFWLLTLLPFCAHRDNALTSHFTKVWPLLGPGERIATDTSTVVALAEDITVKADAAGKYWSMGVPWNLIDERLNLGFGPVPGGDQGYVPIGVMPISAAAERLAPSSQPIPPQLRPAEDEEPDDTDQEDDDDQGDDDNDDQDEQRSGRPGKLGILRASVPDYGTARHKAVLRQIQNLSLPYERRMGARLDEDWVKQRDQVLEAIAALDKKDGKEPRIPIDMGGLFILDTWVAYFATAYEPFYTDMARTAGVDVLSALGLDVPFDLMKPYVQEAIRTMRFKFADDINGTTLEMLEDSLRVLLKDADEGGWSAWKTQEELGRRTDDVFGLRREQWQKERIARTEMGKARSLGRHEGAVQSGMDLLKSWLAAIYEGNTARIRDTHLAAHQRYQANPIPLGESFEVGRDSMLSPRTGRRPEENIQCRCEEVFVVQDTLVASMQGVYYV